jgi:hypothetical protein
MTAPYEPCVLGADGQCTRWSHDHPAENDADLVWLTESTPPSRHAFWGTDPSGYCGCEDCEPRRDIPPAKGVAS